MKPTRLNPYHENLMDMASRIAAGMCAAMDPSQYTSDDARFIIEEATDIAYGIAHKVLDDGFAAEQEEEACYNEYYRYVD
jgi:hypothetical protein